MFGNKKRMSSEEIKAMKEQVEKDIVFYHQMADAKAQIDANISEIDDSRRQVEQEIAQVNDNVSYAASHMQDNISTEASMIFELENLAKVLLVIYHENLVIVLFHRLRLKSIYIIRYSFPMKASSH